MKPVVSNVELECNEFIKSLGYKYERNNKTVLKSFFSPENESGNFHSPEIDFYFPEQKIGIEFDGDYYHNNGIYNANEFCASCWSESFIAPLFMCPRNNPKGIIKFAYSYQAKVFIYHIYEFEWVDKDLREKVKEDIKSLLANKLSIDTSQLKIIIDAAKDNYMALRNLGYEIINYSCPNLIKEKGKLKIYNCGKLTMFNFSRFEQQIDNVEYKGEVYSVRDNGAVLRYSKNDKERKWDNYWTIGERKKDNEHLKIGGEFVYKIIAAAFLGEPPTDKYFVEHIDNDKENNKPSNLKWVTKSGI